VTNKAMTPLAKGASVCLVFSPFAWLMILGQWRLALGGLVIFFAASRCVPAVFRILLMPSLLPYLLVTRARSTGKHPVLVVLGWLVADVYVLAIEFTWCLGWLLLSVSVAPTNVVLIPVLLLSFEVAVSSLAFYATHVESETASALGNLCSTGIVMFAAAGYLVAMTVIAFGNHSLRSMAVVLGVDAGVALIWSTALFISAMSSEMHQPEPERPADEPGEPADKYGPADSEPTATDVNRKTM